MPKKLRKGYTSPVLLLGRKPKQKKTTTLITEKVKLRIGVFFDGTGNNRYNSEIGYYNNVHYKDREKNPFKEDDDTIYDDKKSAGSSYWNSYSNVALLHDLYEEKGDWEKNVTFQELQLKYYEEGIGTLRNEKDVSVTGMIGSGLGEGPRGVIARVDHTCIEIAKKINDLFLERQKKSNKKIEITSIQFDVFGFSRGAAAARHFCNEVLQTKRKRISKNVENIKFDVKKNSLPTKQSLMKEAQKKVIDNTRNTNKNMLPPPTIEVFTGGVLGKALQGKFPKHNVTVEFLGLFDTVISQMLERKGIIDATRNPITKALSNAFSPVLGMVTDAVSLIPKVNLEVSNPNIKKILHLRAQTEWRDNFPITPIKSYASGSFAREFSVFGAHSDVGGGYWQTKEELNTLHFFDLSVNASDEEKQKLEKQKELLRNWYIDAKRNLCTEEQIKWEIMHHVHSFAGEGDMAYDEKDELLSADIMGDEVQTIKNGRTYILRGTHHKLVSTRPLNNKLSLVYMNVMKYIAGKYGKVPFTISENNTKHPEEYKYPEDDDTPVKDDAVYDSQEEDKVNTKKTNLKKFENLIIKVAEHGWKDDAGNIITYPNLVKDHSYSVNSDMFDYIMGKCVHLSANFNSPILEILDHFNFAYPNVPHFKDEKNFQDPPYERQPYYPQLDAYDYKPH
ncbi:phospholipase effector Tle1 domain-containing protein [Cloacibacterium sp.]|uniref:phospholipase effector Tle1 domain-containing protein n=1 Tax=Cloacibacterium sp. TaxID=1913682 RepID=UPI0039E5C21F